MGAGARRFSTAVAALGLAAASAGALALSPGPETKIVCPIDGRSFTARGGGPGSVQDPWRETLGTFREYGRTLDLMPTGATLAPWPLAQCPSNHFVLYKRKFTTEEIAQLRRYVQSAEYRALAAEHTSYYLAAQLQAHLGATPAQLRYVLLQATWQARVGPLYAAYAQKSLEAFLQAIAKPSPDAEERIVDQFLAGELERRLGRFEQAIARFRALSNLGEVDSFGFREALKLQLLLAGARDARQCSLSEPPPDPPRLPGAAPLFYCRTER
jgi:hypothetical protein